MKVKQLIALLEKNGWVHVRTSGDHRTFKKAGVALNVVVVGHLSDTVAPGTLSQTLKKAGLK